jgi:hypothetical protein
MSITSLAVTPAAVSATPGSTAEAAQVLMLRKAMDMQAASAAELLQALPQPAAALATSGTLGRTVNTYA